MGECGLDKLCNVPFERQQDVFARQIEISDKAGKPLLIHCVKAFDELILMRKTYSPQPPWIIHGFRGKPQQVEQLLGKGFYFSFGTRFNEASLRQVPLERLFLETDDTDCNIRFVYERIARTLDISEETLIRQIERNFMIFP